MDCEVYTVLLTVYNECILILNEGLKGAIFVTSMIPLGIRCSTRRQVTNYRQVNRINNLKVTSVKQGQFFSTLINPRSHLQEHSNIARDLSGISNIISGNEHIVAEVSALDSNSDRFSNEKICEFTLQLQNSVWYCNVWKIKLPKDRKSVFNFCSVFIN